MLWYLILSDMDTDKIVQSVTSSLKIFLVKLYVSWAHYSGTIFPNKGNKDKPKVSTGIFGKRNVDFLEWDSVSFLPFRPLNLS